MFLFVENDNQNAVSPG